jgi:hypothetical protein
MAPADIRILTQRKPFRPFRIVTSDGTVYDVRHPDLVMIGLSSMHFWNVPLDGHAGIDHIDNHRSRSSRMS